MVFFNRAFLLITLSGLLAFSSFGADNFGLKSIQRVVIEIESFLRHSEYKTSITKFGSFVKASKDGSSITVNVISLSSDSSTDQGVICYVSTSDSAIFDKLSKDLNSFASLYNINIDVVRTQ